MSTPSKETVERYIDQYGGEIPDWLLKNNDYLRRGYEKYKKEIEDDKKAVQAEENKVINAEKATALRKEGEEQIQKIDAPYLPDWYKAMAPRTAQSALEDKSIPEQGWAATRDVLSLPGRGIRQGLLALGPNVTNTQMSDPYMREESQASLGLSDPTLRSHRRVTGGLMNLLTDPGTGLVGGTIGAARGLGGLGLSRIPWVGRTLTKGVSQYLASPTRSMASRVAVPMAEGVASTELSMEDEGIIGKGIQGEVGNPLPAILGGGLGALSGALYPWQKYRLQSKYGMDEQEAGRYLQGAGDVTAVGHDIRTGAKDYYGTVKEIGDEYTLFKPDRAGDVESIKQIGDLDYDDYTTVGPYVASDRSIMTGTPDMYKSMRQYGIDTKSVGLNDVAKKMLGDDLASELGVPDKQVVLTRTELKDLLDNAVDRLRSNKTSPENREKIIQFINMVEQGIPDAPFHLHGRDEVLGDLIDYARAGYKRGQFKPTGDKGMLGIPYGLDRAEHMMTNPTALRATEMGRGLSQMIAPTITNQMYYGPQEAE